MVLLCLFHPCCLPPRLAWPPPLWGAVGRPPRKNFLGPGGGFEADAINFIDLARSFIFLSNPLPNRLGAELASSPGSPWVWLDCVGGGGEARGGEAGLRHPRNRATPTESLGTRLGRNQRTDPPQRGPGSMD